MALSWLVIAVPVAVFALLSAGTPQQPDYETPVDYDSTPTEYVDEWTPEPAPEEPIRMQPGPERDCGDGTRGTFAECWQRLQQEALAETSRSATAQPSAPSDWPTFAIPATPSLAPPTVTVCVDGSLSNSTGRGTCSWHGGMAP